MSHTPGPWIHAQRLQATVEGHGYMTDFASVEIPAVAGGGIALVRIAGQGEGNARLIASAPDLLEALIRLREWVRCPGVDDSPENEAVIYQADAAIRKATEVTL